MIHLFLLVILTRPFRFLISSCFYPSLTSVVLCVTYFLPGLSERYYMWWQMLLMDQEGNVLSLVRNSHTYSLQNNPWKPHCPTNSALSHSKRWFISSRGEFNLLHLDYTYKVYGLNPDVIVNEYFRSFLNIPREKCLKQNDLLRHVPNVFPPFCIR